MTKRYSSLFIVFLLTIILLAPMAGPKKAHASEPFLAQITMFGGNFAPRGWAFCDGQLLAISQNSALFSLLGTIYGGDGRTTFALPDLRGRTAIGPRTGAGLSTYREGQRGGAERVTLTIAEIPSHNHTGVIVATDATGNSETPGGNILAKKSRDRDYHSGAPVTVNMSDDSVTIGNTGSGNSHENMQPWIAINHIIALQGTFPSRN